MIPARTKRDDNRAACLGAATNSHRLFMEHMEECRLCGMQVRWDLIEHPYFGFRVNCGYETPSPADGGSE